MAGIFQKSLIRFQTFAPNDKLPAGIIFPEQTHSDNICKIVKGDENLADTDGIFTENQNLTLGIKTADCLPIVFIENGRFGLVHAGWRGLVNNIIEKMLMNFSDPEIFVAPFLHQFEIQKDDCYLQIQQKFGEQFFNIQEDKIIFDFLGAVKSVLPQAKIDQRNTFLDNSLASWRRDKNNLRNYTVVGVF